jgi:uncharacterized membrane protein YbhN (UPF0104 family)
MDPQSRAERREVVVVGAGQAGLVDIPARNSGIAKYKRLLWPMAGALVAAGIIAATPVSRTSLTETVTSFDVVHWPWLVAAVIAEAGSMAAFARAQRRLLRAAGTRVPIGPVMAVTYAGNAISTSLPLAGPGLSSAFSIRQFRHRGVDDGVIAWAMIVSGLVSSVALAVVLTAGAVVVGSATAAMLGLAGAIMALLPVSILLAGLRFPVFRRALNRILSVLVTGSRRLIGRPDIGVTEAFETSLEKLVAIRVAFRRYLGVLALSIWNWVADCLCLVFAIQATGSVVPWRGMLLAFGAGITASSIGLTPGGIGITEVALSGALVVAGMAGRRALHGVLIYRLISFWCVVAAGWVVMAAISLCRHKAAVPDDDQ